MGNKNHKIKTALPEVLPYLLKNKEVKGKKYNQKELAKYLGVQAQTVGRYISGATEPPMSALVKCAMLFNVSLDYLVFGDNSLCKCKDKYDAFIEDIAECVALKVAEKEYSYGKKDL